MKRIIYFFLVILTFASIIWVSNAKYKDTSVLDISITSAKMYFEDSATDINIPYNHNNANIAFNVHNYIEQNYTIQDIQYSISISNNNYTFNINNTSNAVNNSVDLQIDGGERNSDEIHMNFTRLDDTNVPATEDIVVTIETTYPYTYSRTFTVTISNGTIEVLGNPTSWTKEDVTLTVAPTPQGLVLTEYSFDNGTTWVTQASKVYSANEDNIQVFAKDNLGQVLGPVTVDITKIDKTPPTIVFAKDNEHWKNAQTDEFELKEVETLIVTLNESTSVLTGVTATDTQSGVSEDGVKCYRGQTEIIRTNYFDDVGRYLVTYKVQDEVGNEAVETREILVRWPTAGKYVAARQETVGTGHSSSTSPDGLYKDTSDTGHNVAIPFSSKYYYAGADVDNYVSFAGSTYRILNIATNDDLKMLGDVSDVKTAWGSRKIFESNTYNTWSTKWWPRGQIYNHEDGESKYKLFTEEEKAHVDLATFYAGRFTKSEADDITNTIYYEQTSARELGGDSAAFEGYSAYPNVSDYLKACKAHDIIKNIDDTQVQSLFGTSNRTIFANNSWIDMSVDQWTMNSKRTTATDNDFWVVDTAAGTNIQSRTYYYNQQYRVVFYLKYDTILSGIGEESGDGIHSGPFTVQENWSWFDPEQIVQ